MKSLKDTNNHYSLKHRILSWSVLIGIFICGVMVGAIHWGNKPVNAADSGVQANVAQEDEYVPPCRLLEEALLENINGHINNGNWDADEKHDANARVYERLVKVGCSENVEKYKSLVESEIEIAENLRVVNNKSKKSFDDFDDSVEYEYEEVEPCVVIEKTLRERIQEWCSNANCHLNNAEIYSKMAEDGCPGNKEVNTKKALDELQIAEGVRIDEREIGNNEIRTTVNTYKKLQMQNEAKKYLNKVEKLVNPGIDFILELQRVIEE